MFKHAFEWGTLGITRQADKHSPTPLGRDCDHGKTILNGQAGPAGGASGITAALCEFKLAPGLSQCPGSDHGAVAVFALDVHQFTLEGKVMEEMSQFISHARDAQSLLIP